MRLNLRIKTTPYRTFCSIAVIGCVAIGAIYFTKSIFIAFLCAAWDKFISLSQKPRTFLYITIPHSINQSIQKRAFSSCPKEIEVFQSYCLIPRLKQFSMQDELIHLKMRSFLRLSISNLYSLQNIQQFLLFSTMESFGFDIEPLLNSSFSSKAVMLIPDFLHNNLILSSGVIISLHFTRTISIKWVDKLEHLLYNGFIN